MIQQSQAKYNEDEVEYLVKNYFKPGKLLYNWSNLFFNYCYFQENQISQQEKQEDYKTIKFMFQKDNHQREFQIKHNQKIIVGSLSELQNKTICGDNVNSNLCKFHFTFMFKPNMFGLAWVKCLKNRLAALEIKKKIASFVRFESEIEMEDVSDRNYSSYVRVSFSHQLKTPTNQQITMKQQTYYLEAYYEECQQFQINQLTNEELQNLTPQILYTKYIFILGTTHDILINEQLIKLLSVEENQNEINQIKNYLTLSLNELKTVYNDAKLIKTNSSFLQILLFSASSEPKFHDFNLNYGYQTDYKQEMQKFEKILKSIKYENKYWWISNELLNKEIKKNQKYFIQRRDRIITITPNGVEVILIQIDE